jgi:hypothetical protein
MNATPRSQEIDQGEHGETISGFSFRLVEQRQGHRLGSQKHGHAVRYRHFVAWTIIIRWDLTQTLYWGGY